MAQHWAQNAQQQWHITERLPKPKTSNARGEIFHESFLTKVKVPRTHCSGSGERIMQADVSLDCRMCERPYRAAEFIERQASEK